MNNLILAIDTSCDETSVAITQEHKVLTNVISSQVKIHKKYGGVFPALAKRAHQEKIDYVVAQALKSFNFPSDFVAIAVTCGPGLAIALEVGIAKAKELSLASKLPLIGVNHMEGHLYSSLAQNSKGQPQRKLVFPSLALLVSGGHTELVLIKEEGKYQLLGATLDDACGEALDKAAKILKLGYPGGPIIERLAEESVLKKQKLTINNSSFTFNKPLKEKNNLNFSYSGLKTQFLYLVNSLSQKEFAQNLLILSSLFQEAAFEQLIRKTKKAIELYQPKCLLCGGGVMANKHLRKLLRCLTKEQKIPVYFPFSKKLVTDNAAMIGVAAWHRYQNKDFIKDLANLDRVPRLTF